MLKTIASAQIFKLRDSLDMTQEEFAHALGVVKGTVQHWEAGRAKPRARQQRKIQTLMKGQPPDREKPRRYSEETREQLIEALDVILDSAPSTVVEQTAEFLTLKAGKYGKPKD